jgi:hypothetical protein
MTRPDPPADAAPEDVRTPHPPLVGATLGVVGAVFAMLVGGWLMLAPFALGYQPDGADWADPTHADFWAGLGLLVLGAIVLVASTVDLVGRLRAAGAITSRRPAPAAAEPAAPPAPARDDELTALLKPLIAALGQDAERGASHNGSTRTATDPANPEMPR